MRFRDTARFSVFSGLSEFNSELFCGKGVLIKDVNVVPLIRGLLTQLCRELEISLLCREFEREEGTLNSSTGLGESQILESRALSFTPANQEPANNVKAVAN